MTREERASLDRERWKLDGKGDHVAAKPPSQAYRDGWERVFGMSKAERAQITKDIARAMSEPHPLLDAIREREHHGRR